MNKAWTSPEGFEALVREHQATVFRTLSRLVGGGGPMDDLAQEVFLRLYRALPEFRGAAMISTYLYRIVVNVAQDEWKRRRREREHLATGPSFPDGEEEQNWLANQPGDPAREHHRTPEKIVADGEMRAVVEAALLELSEPERAVLVLFHGEECSYEGIAEALGLPVNTVRTHLHRGRKRLAAVVAQRLAPRVHPTQQPAKAGAR